MSKPHLIMGGRAYGKTTKLLELIKNRNAFFICHSLDAKRYMEEQYGHRPEFKDVQFIACNNIRAMHGRHKKIACIDEWFYMKDMWWTLDFIKAHGVEEIHISATNEFDIEILDNPKEKK